MSLAVRVFAAIGDGSYSEFISIPNLPEREQHKYWILESITANYGSSDYYLFAEAAAYRRYDGSNWGNDIYKNEVVYRAPGWDAVTVPNAVLSDPVIKPFFVNRGYGIFANARAGHKNIIERWNPVPTRYPSLNPYDHWIVLGTHFYHSARTRRTTQHPSSEASDCNLSQWGIEFR